MALSQSVFSWGSGIEASSSSDRSVRSAPALLGEEDASTPALNVKKHGVFCLVMTGLTVMVMFVSFTSTAWETVTFDVRSVLHAAAHVHSNYQVSVVTFDDYGKVCLDVRVHESSSPAENHQSLNSSSAENASYPKWMLVPTYRESSMWELCDTIPVMSVSKSAVACAVTSLICVLVAIGLGVFAAARQQIIFAMITGVCFLASTVYTSFAVVLIMLRKYEMEKDTRIPPLLYNNRNISNSWAMYVCWLGFAFSAMTGSGWILFSKELQRTRVNYMYTSKYDQICSM